MSHHPRSSAAIGAIAAVAAVAIAAPSAGTAAAIPAHAAGSCAAASSAPSPGQLDRAARATLCLLDQERARHGLRPLRANPRLAAAAGGHSADMVRRHYFSHTAPGNLSFATRIVRTRYVRGARGWSLGENIAWASGSGASPAAIVRMWMRSPGHRANVLAPGFREIGIGIAHGVPSTGGAGGGGGATYTTDFGRRS
ncbi:MAG: hypothetical protein JWQ48_2457 [Conexibacter sp.]|nr:hypothetical protein [Conexibacter sp.]